MALAAYATESGILILFTNQLDLAEKKVSALLPIDKLTNFVSADSASMTVIIPFVKMLIKTLEKHHNDSGVRTMKKNCFFLQSVGLAIILSQSSCLLDPRFKDTVPLNYNLN